MTEIGERGINLSGGQKARVSLARALYSADVQLLLMDDPLSAVDSNVGEHLFDQAIASTTLCPTATKVLVTHHVHFLHRCDAVVVMEAGKVAHFGKVSDHKFYPQFCRQREERSNPSVRQHASTTLSYLSLS